ncbi:MAG: hypothetical protein IT285_12510 [Bdellovibrionales bacterium]|nr:hypothetical protein [Bdellovibrionales bacterium]
MNPIRPVLVSLFALVLSSAASAAPIQVSPVGKGAKKDRTEVWSACDACAAPESAFFDPESKLLFVSNVAGAPNEKDGKGWIEKRRQNGRGVNVKWVTGLNAPKGMRSHRGVLWVSDIDRVLGFRISSGKQVREVKIEGAKFLNDVEVGPNGDIYVSDTVVNKIYQIDGSGQAKVFFEGEAAESPNGLLVVGDSLVVAPWGAGFDNWAVKTPGHLYSVHLRTREKKLITPAPLGNLDGLEREASGAYLVSDWVAGKIWRVSQAGKPELLFEGFKGAADLGYVPDLKQIIVPRMNENMISAYQL